MSFEKLRDKFLITYRLKSELTGGVAESLASDLRKEIEKNAQFEGILIDIQNYDFGFKAIRALSPFGLELRKQKKQFYLLSQVPSVHQLIRAEGMDSIVKPIFDLNEIRGTAAPGKSAPKLDVAFINPFIEGTIHVLNVQCQTRITAAAPMLKGKEDFKCQTDIAGIIGITSQRFKGSIAICFPEKVFLGLMSKMLGEEFSEITDDLKDGAAELLNMIFGHAKKVLNENGHTIDKALPSVVRGPNLKIDHSGSHDSIVLPFKTEDSVFFMEIGTEKN